MCRISLRLICWRRYVVVPLGPMPEPTAVFLPVLIVFMLLIALTFHPVDKSWIINFLFFFGFATFI